MINHSLILMLAVSGSAAPALPGAEMSAPEFTEVEQIVREHLLDATQATVNRAAVEGFLRALDGRVLMVTNTESAAPNPSALLSRQAVFDGTVAYLRVGNVESGLAPALETAIKETSASNRLAGLVLDLRFCGGGDYPAAASAVELFLNKQMPLVNPGTGMISSAEKTNAVRLPVVALVNNGTSHAAEVLAAMLRQTGVGLLVGSRTAGRVGVMSDFRLSSGQTLRVMTAPIQLGDGSSLSSTGVVPDIAVTVGAEDERAFFSDPYLAAVSPNGASSSQAATNGPTAARLPKRARLTEADLVRERRGEGEEEEVVSGERVKPVREVPSVEDPALARAIDLLKGLAVVRQGRL
jgi:hypothetical protein